MRPQADHLTNFYLMVSFGGAAGGNLCKLDRSVFIHWLLGILSCMVIDHYFVGGDVIASIYLADKYSGTIDGYIFCCLDSFAGAWLKSIPRKRFL